MTSWIFPLSSGKLLVSLVTKSFLCQRGPHYIWGRFWILLILGMEFLDFRNFSPVVSCSVCKMWFPLSSWSQNIVSNMQNSSGHLVLCLPGTVHYHKEKKSIEYETFYLFCILINIFYLFEKNCCIHLSVCVNCWILFSLNQDTIISSADDHLIVSGLWLIHFAVTWERYFYFLKETDHLYFQNDLHHFCIPSNVQDFWLLLVLANTLFYRL